MVSETPLIADAAVPHQTCAENTLHGLRGHGHD